MNSRVDCLNKRRAAELLGGEYFAEVCAFRILADDFSDAAASGNYRNIVA
jgi:hypothetical protein